MTKLLVQYKFAILFIFLTLMMSIIYSCTKAKGELDLTGKGYPQEVAKILINKCSTTGCHNDASKEAAGGISFSSWDKMFEGSRGGAVVVPYRPDLSTLIYYINSYNEYGTIQLNPKMPLNNSALTRDEVKILYDWILSGAPNADDIVKFSDNANRKKFYVANQGCDLVTVFDAQTMLAMRYVSVGISPSIEAPHMIKVAPNNKFWCVSYIAGSSFQKYSTTDNSLLGQVNLGFGSWNTFVITKDSEKAYVIDWSNNGKVAIVDLINMTSTIASGFIYPHGSALNKTTDDTLYVTSQMGNFIYKMPVNDFGNTIQISLDANFPNSTSSLDPHEISFSPDGTKYFVSCQRSNEIRVMKTSNDSLLAVIPVGDFPQEMAISPTKNHLFVSCMEDMTSFGSTKRGSIHVIDMSTHSVIKKIYTGHQPHGIMVDEQHGRVYVTNRNVTTDGPAPHHASLCYGRNGYVTAIDLNSLQLIPGYKAEVSADPYGYAITH